MCRNDRWPACLPWRRPRVSPGPPNYRDPDGFSTGLAQNLVSATLTANVKLGGGKSNGSMVLLRPEIRYDTSSAKFYAKNDDLRSVGSQLTAGVGASWLF